MFLDSLYTVRQVTGSGKDLTFEIDFRADHPLYSGHFPGRPVTPGVVLAEIVKELLEKHLETGLQMTGMRQCKFLAAHNPAEVPSMRVAVRWTEDGGYSVQADGTSSSGTETPATFFRLSAFYRVE